MERLTKDQQQSQVNERQLRDELKKRNDYVTLKLQQELSSSRKLRHSQTQEIENLIQKVDHIAQSVTQLTEQHGASKRWVDQLRQSHSQMQGQIDGCKAQLHWERNMRGALRPCCVNKLHETAYETQVLKQKVDRNTQRFVWLTGLLVIVIIFIVLYIALR